MAFSQGLEDRFESEEFEKFEKWEYAFYYFFLFLCEFEFFLLRIETQGTEDDWEQIDARDIGENSRYLPDRTLLIFFCESNFYLRETEDDREQIVARGHRENNWHFRINNAEGRSGRALLLGTDRCWGIRERKIGDDRMLRRNQTPPTGDSFFEPNSE